VVFTIDAFGLDGRTLDPCCQDPTGHYCVSYNLLRWHYHQSVLANTRKEGEPIFEHDFPPGTDMVSEIEGGPYVQEPFELEMVARLTAVSYGPLLCSRKFATSFTFNINFLFSETLQNCGISSKSAIENTIHYREPFLFYFLSSH